MFHDNDPASFSLFIFSPFFLTAIYSYFFLPSLYTPQLDTNDHTRSGTQRATSNPDWEEDKVLLVDSLSKQLQVMVYDDEYGQGLLHKKR
jgi:hypothetical protein